MDTRPLTTADLFDDVELIDHHCHGVLEHTLDRGDYEHLISESNWPPAEGTSAFDSQLGVAIRRWCAPVLGLEPGVSPEQYLNRREELRSTEVNARFLTASGISHYLIETGYRGDDILTPEGMAERAGAQSYTVVRLERLAEQLFDGGTSSSAFPDAYRGLLAAELTHAVGVKSIAAYRIGLDFNAERPTDTEVRAAAAGLIAQIERTGQPARLDDAVLIRFALWCAVDAKQAIQFHVGYGDPDVDLHRCNPLALTDFLRATRTSGARILLLHCYPYHREAGYLAHVFPHTYCDVGLAINYVGARSAAIIAESLELTPFDKALFSTDAFGLSELYYVGAELFRKGLTSTLNDWIEADEWSIPDAHRLVRKITGENARLAYRLDEVTP